jgi:hypothetical protein
MTGVRRVITVGFAATIVAAIALMATPGISSAATVTRCLGPVLQTGFGNLRHCTQINGNQARPGFLSLETGGFSPELGWLPLVIDFQEDETVPSTDGVTARFQGRVIVQTAYGNAIFGTQIRGSGDRQEGRWGNWNIPTNTFSPSSGWVRTTPIAG